MKVQLTQDSDKTKYNDARMIEFIFNIQTGQIVSEWNAYDKHMINGKIDPNPADYEEKELYQIANTESFNYGVPKGKYKLSDKYKKLHDKLDIHHPQDPALRDTATNKYVSERDMGKGGEYVDIVSAGGEKDVKEWNKIPDSQKPKKYKEYAKWARIALMNKHSIGFSNYMKEED